ncbi:hypothetical protein PSPTO_4005 [Pseudomonas syringae pv. tomato str. DC3000]|uniref:Uncharacterized protein n=1 Tax=Pseudomonas syringae pv. tomato (strain ATCC BAA-871 / DC3000) TaxID=223283 RepID=Q87Y13_PSESM|nr:hypothetical protein PSPTO_4005 [Pseudomonas syringae pv. tomato str. DC3000]MBW8020189.1 hypothetical protein [Pseudomonas syringae pv. tomato]PYD05258.1 hypothetical protein DND90_16050 [Pseudomonas syringae pv. maculicola]
MPPGQQLGELFGCDRQFTAQIASIAVLRYQVIRHLQTQFYPELGQQRRIGLDNNVLGVLGSVATGVQVLDNGLVKRRIVVLGNVTTVASNGYHERAIVFKGHIGERYAQGHRFFGRRKRGRQNLFGSVENCVCHAAYLQAKP